MQLCIAAFKGTVDCICVLTSGLHHDLHCRFNLDFPLMFT